MPGLAEAARGGEVGALSPVLGDEAAADTARKVFTVVLRGQEAHHLRDVLRLGGGAPVEAFDGRGNVARGEVVRADRDGVVLGLGPLARSDAEAGLRLTVAVALLKGDKLSDVVRQCTELGAAAFALTLTRQADVGELSAAKLQRLRRVVEEAARQCGRATVPELRGPLPLAELSWRGVAFVADPRADVPLKDVAAATGHADVTVVTGPEGGFTPTEVAELVARGAVAVGLGPRVLRAETAPMAMVAALMLGVGGSAAEGGEAANGEIALREAGEGEVADKGEAGGREAGSRERARRGFDERGTDRA